MTTNKPKLRFPEFSDNWEEKKLGEIVKINQGLQIAISERYTEQIEGTFFYITNEFLKEGSEKKYYIKNPTSSVLCTKEDILMTRTGNTGMVVTNVEGAFHNNFFKIVYPDYIKKEYLFYFLNLIQTQTQILKLAGTSTIPDLNHSDFYRIKIQFPQLPEQTKIANFLTAIDEKINLLKKKKSLLEEYKKGIMQQLFTLSPSGRAGVGLRFKKEDGSDFEDWDFAPLSDYLYEPKARNYDMTYSKDNVLSVSGEFGIVNQIEHLGRSYAGVSVANYHVVQTGDIVYTKSPLKANPYGIIKVNKGQAGIVSTLYAVYGCKENLNGIYLDYYFQLDDNLNKYLRPLVRKGAKNDMKINNTHVLSGYIWFPCLEEQQKIATFLSAIDEKIESVAQAIEATQVYKKGLLQQLFC